MGTHTEGEMSAALVRYQSSAIAMALWVVAMVLLVRSSSAAPHPVCRVEGSDDFDLSPLQKGEEEKPYYAVSPHGHYHYYFNFCGHASGCYQQPACQVRLVTDSSGRAKEDVATVTTTGELYRMKWEELDADDLEIVNKEAAKAKIHEEEYKSGVKVTYSIGPKHRKTIVRVPCDPEADEADRQSPLEVVEKPILTYNIIYPSPHGCKIAFTKKSIKLPSMHGVAHSKTSFFTIMFLAILTAYCCVGCYYKREKLGAQGWEIIPHIDSITACAESVMGCFTGESAVGNMLNRARGVNDDGL